jgi:hypothetical protein
MKLAVSYDEQGDIVTLFDPHKLHHGVKYVPEEDEKHAILEVPKEFEGKPFRELAALLRVNATGPHPRLELKA